MASIVDWKRAGSDAALAGLTAPRPISRIVSSEAIRTMAASSVPVAVNDTRTSEMALGVPTRDARTATEGHPVHSAFVPQPTEGRRFERHRSRNGYTTRRKFLHAAATGRAGSAELTGEPGRLA